MSSAGADRRSVIDLDRGGTMSVIATITTSLDGYVTGPGDGPGCGLGVGGERLHHWVMGGPWTYAGERDVGQVTGADKEFYDDLVATIGATVCGRGMYDAAGAWGGTNPFDGTLFVLTHRTADAPDASSGFVFVDDLATALARAADAAPGRDVGIGGGADVIRQALAAGYVDELAISTAPVVLGAGKRLFDGFTQDVELEIRRVYQSPYATHVRYAIRR
jgi:dihydrofolate reductase